MIESAIKVKNYKCFGNEAQGFEKILPINVIIGRNNSGKSALLEVIEYVVNPNESFQSIGHIGTVSEVLISQSLKEDTISRIFKKETSGGGIPGSNHLKYGKYWLGNRITYQLKTNSKHSLVEISPRFTEIYVPDNILNPYLEKLAEISPNPFQGKIFKRLRAERNIFQENGTRTINIDEYGNGATNIIQEFINLSSLPRERVEHTVLKALNEIYQPDSNFSRIIVQSTQVASGLSWEVYLEEPVKGLIPLSHTGSGLKTILLVLLFFYLIPYVEKRDISDYVFAFEELENNLHPALQRRLLSYIREFVVKHGCHLFTTTHSNVVIDLFCRDDQAYIVHVIHDGEKASVKPVQTFIDNKSVLDDLDVRASDLLQSNCVVWVEGPSDRVYFNKWIQIWTKGVLKEGIHYQCVFYGGRLLAHMSAQAPEKDSQDAIVILRINRNAIIIMDSDKRGNASKVNDTKQRIAEEVRAMEGIAWITNGREIENYLPQEAISKYYKKTPLPPIKKFESIADYLNSNIGVKEGQKFERNKIEFAGNICRFLTRDNLSSLMDLPDKLTKICTQIKQWNKIN